MRRAAVLGACVALAGCYASSPLAPNERAVVPAVDVVTWRPAKAEDLPGLWESRRVEGGSAGAVLKAYYAFDADGGYTAAAMVLDEGRPRLVLLADAGRWTLDGPTLDLHDGTPPFTVSAALDRLRLVQGEDALELARVPLD